MFQSKTVARLLAVAGAAIVALALAAPAQAVPPAPPYSQFAGCPSPEEDPSVVLCTHGEIYGGHFQMGNKDVPITKTMHLTGGLDANAENFVANSEGGLTPVKQQVPGGIIGLTGLDWLVNFLDIEELKLYAITELTAPPVIGETLDLSIKVHLINPVLGNSCYVGSNSNPIKLSLTTGTTNPPPPNEPITGKEPKFTIDQFGILNFDEGIFVDNSFAAPGANGCKLVLFGFLPISINGLVNSASGLPSPAGTNETVQEQNLELTGSELVYP